MNTYLSYLLQKNSIFNFIAFSISLLQDLIAYYI